MPLLRPGDHDEILKEAKKYIALHDCVMALDGTGDNRWEESHREDLHRQAEKLRKKIEDNINDADRSYSY